jgi:hypothetical protein
LPQVVTWWVGDSVRAQAWDVEVKPSAHLLAVLVERCMEGDSKHKPIELGTRRVMPDRCTRARDSPL